jgi:hypothetical protein
MKDELTAYSEYVGENIDGLLRLGNLGNFLIWKE